MKFILDLFVLVASFSVFIGSNQADSEVTFYRLDCNETNELNTTHVVLDSKAASTLLITRDSRAFAFEHIVIATGIVGTGANGVMFVTMFKSKQISTKDTKYLILNQLVLDLFSCVLVVVTYSLKVLDITYDDGVGFRFVCSLLASEFLLFVSMLNSTNSLVAIAIERYLKIVRWACSRHNYYKPWMTRMMIITTWSLTVILTSSEIPTSRVIGGQCITLAFWSYKWSGQVYAFFVSLLSYVVPYSIMVHLYWRILKFVRLKAQIRSGSGSYRVWHQTTSFRKQISSLKTLLMRVVCGAILWTPNIIYFILAIMVQLQVADSFRDFTVFLVVFNVCLNPVIYASRQDEIKLGVRRMYLAIHKMATSRIEDESKPSANTDTIIGR